MIEFFKKYNLVILGVLIVLIIVAIIIALRSFLYPDDLKSIYGNRLNDIEQYAISNAELNEITEKSKEIENIKDLSIDVKGKIVNIMLEVEEESKVEDIKKSMESTLKNFDDELIEYYDFQFFLTNENLEFIIIGYKNKNNEEIVYTEYTKVSEEDLDEEE